jgi:hypothetical protein
VCEAQVLALVRSPFTCCDEDIQQSILLLLFEIDS